jgi:hypothetical protein
MTLGSHQTSIGRSQVHCTPKWIIDALGGASSFDLDPCAADPRPWDCARKGYIERDNGLSLPWRGRVWLNPPFDRYEVARWIERLAQHSRGTCLLHARTEAAWFEPIWQHASGILFMADRIKFCRPDGSEQPANSGAPPILATFGDGDRERLRASGIPGALVERWQWIETRPARTTQVQRTDEQHIERIGVEGQTMDGEQLDFFLIGLPPCGRGLGSCVAVVEGTIYRCTTCNCVAKKPASAQWPPPWPVPRSIPTAAWILARQRQDHAPGGFVEKAKALAAALPSVSDTETAMKKDDLWPSKFLKASDFPQPRALKIKKARVETLKNKGGEDEKLVVHFEGETRGLALNRVNFDSIVDITGAEDSDNWAGHPIELYATTTQMNGGEVPCVRVRAPEIKSATKAKPAAKKKPIGEDLNDEIGF